MDIVKKFNESTEIIIKGTSEEPLFRANDVAIILGIKDINSTIRDSPVVTVLPTKDVNRTLCIGNVLKTGRRTLVREKKRKSEISAYRRIGVE